MVFEDGEIFINVWNCRAGLVAVKERGNITDLYGLDIDLTDEEHDALVEQVESFGGAINISGWYPLLWEELPDSLKKKVETALEEISSEFGS